MISIGCSPGKAGKNNFLLEKTVSWTIEGVRTWQTFDSKIPAEKSSMHWISGSNTMRCSAFAPYESSEPEKASGRFWEFTVWFENKGQEEKTVWFHQNDKKGLDMRLVVPENSVPVKAFLIPGLNIAPISLATAWEGTLGIKLAPGEKTWLLLVFDVPGKYDSAEFKLKDTSPVPIELPALSAGSAAGQ
jgi:hypothetical protein